MHCLLLDTLKEQCTTLVSSSILLCYDMVSIDVTVNQEEAGDRSVKAASRSTGTIVGGLVGSIGGPGGAIAGGILGGSLTDALTTGIDSAVHDEYLLL